MNINNFGEVEITVVDVLQCSRCMRSVEVNAGGLITIPRINSFQLEVPAIIAAVTEHKPKVRSSMLLFSNQLKQSLGYFFPINAVLCNENKQFQGG